MLEVTGTGRRVLDNFVMATYCGLIGCAAAFGDGPAVPDGFGGGAPELGCIAPAGCSAGLLDGPAVAKAAYVSAAQRACKAIAQGNRT
jgi:hypothetical protein